MIPIENVSISEQYLIVKTNNDQLTTGRQCNRSCREEVNGENKYLIQ